MARTLAELPKGARITDYMSLGVLTAFPRARIDAVLAATKTASRRQRELPAHVVVYYVIALTLYMQVSYREVLRCLLEGLEWMAGPARALKVTDRVFRRPGRASGGVRCSSCTTSWLARSRGRRLRAPGIGAGA